MLTKLNVFSFHKCKPLLHEHEQLEVAAVIEGINAGRVFLDNHQFSTTALV